MRQLILYKLIVSKSGKWIVSDTNDKNVYSFIYNKDRTNLFESFIKDNNYSIVWENELFTIYAVKQ